MAWRWVSDTLCSYESTGTSHQGLTPSRHPRLPPCLIKQMEAGNVATHRGGTGRDARAEGNGVLQVAQGWLGLSDGWLADGVVALDVDLVLEMH